MRAFSVNKKASGLLLLDSQSNVFVKLYSQYRGPRIIFGFRDRSNRGRICNDMSAFSRVKDGEMLLMWWVYFPRWVMISIYKEYKAVITMFAPIRIIVVLDHEKVDITTNNSPIRLIVGGRARLVRLASSHQVAISGSRVCRPRAKIIVRLWTRS